MGEKFWADFCNTDFFMGVGKALPDSENECSACIINNNVLRFRAPSEKKGERNITRRSVCLCDIRTQLNEAALQKYFCTL
jgi:hypothetical protein